MGVLDSKDRRVLGMKFRDLRADEIEVRVSRVTQAGVELLLYKTSLICYNIT